MFWPVVTLTRTGDNPMGILVSLHESHLRDSRGGFNGAQNDVPRKSAQPVIVDYLQSTQIFGCFHMSQNQSG